MVVLLICLKWNKYIKIFQIMLNTFHLQLETVYPNSSETVGKHCN
jgi:hypothetical protein